MINSHSPAHRNDGRLAWILIAPALIGFAVFVVYPTVRGIYLSFTDFTVLTPPTWTGFDNIVRLFGDQVFWSSLGVTVYFVLLSVAIGMTISVLTAVVLHRLTSSAVAADQLAKGVDLSVFVDSAKNEWIYPAYPSANGSEMGTTIQPLMEAYFTHERDADVFDEMAETSKGILKG